MMPDDAAVSKPEKANDDNRVQAVAADRPSNDHNAQKRKRQNQPHINDRL